MTTYRLYFVGRDGHFANVVQVEADDDANATKLVGRHATGQSMELWDGARRVKVFPAREARP